MEGVYYLKYPGLTLYQSNNDLTEIIRNIRRAQKVWGHLGKILQQEGRDFQVLTMFYCSLIQVVLLFGS